MKNLKKSVTNALIPAVLISIVSSGILLFLNGRGKFESIELKTLDMRFVARKERKFRNAEMKDRAHVIAIDAKTINAVGRWPWPRGVIAKLISGACGAAAGEAVLDAFGEPAAPAEPVKKKAEVAGAGASGVLGIDILFDRKERPFKDSMLKPGAMMDPVEQDAMAVEAIGGCPAVVYVSLMKFAAGKSLKSADLGVGDNTVFYNTDDGDLAYNQPIKQYVLDNTRAGFANMQLSSYDERVRKARLYFKAGDKRLYSFALMNIASFLGVAEKDIKVGKYSVTVGKLNIPTDDNGNIYINYRGKEFKEGEDGEAIKENVHSALDIMGKDSAWMPMNMRDNAIFLIGVTDPEIRDVFSTPYSLMPAVYPQLGTLSGVEVHKEIIDTILQGDYLRDAAAGAAAVLLFAAGLVVCLCTLFRLWAGFAGVVACGAAYITFAFGAFNSTGTIYPVVTVLLTLPVCLAASMLFRNLVVDREKNKVKDIFKSYVAPHVLAELMDNPDNLMLVGEKRKVSVLFSDIRGFTTISEQLDPQVLILGLNHYLSEMTKTVLDNSGMIDKFIGDAVMAVWGAPVPHADDARRAVTAAVLMESALERINPKIKEYTGFTFAIGVGINTGDATLGNIGSENKLDYTVIGDTVNLASRLESLTKQYGAFVVVSEFTYAEIKDYFECRLLDDVKVKGKDKPVAIYQVYCDKGKLPQNIAIFLKSYNGAMGLYKERKFGEAKAMFVKAMEAIPEEKTATIYLERCDHFIAEPPPADWDGSFTWKTK